MDEKLKGMPDDELMALVVVDTTRLDLLRLLDGMKELPGPLRISPSWSG